MMPKYVEWFEAVSLNNVEEVEGFLLCGATVNDTDQVGRNMLAVASCYGCTEVGLLLISQGADVNEYNRGTIPLIRAARSGHPDFVRMLIDKGAKINERNSLTRTALMEAAIENHMKVLRVLIEHDADVSLRDYKDITAEAYAAARGDEEMRLFLRAAPELQQRERTRKAIARSQLLLTANAQNYVIRRKVQP